MNITNSSAWFVILNLWISKLETWKQEEEIEPEQVIKIDIPRVKADLGKEIHFVKLPNFLSVEPKPFSHDTYEDENKTGEPLDDEGNTRVRLKVKLKY